MSSITASRPLDIYRSIILLGTHLIGNVYTDGCHWRGTALDPPVGPSVDDLATALVTQGGPGTAAPTDVTIGGHPGKKVELSIPASVDVATCDKQDGFPVFGRWSGPGYPLGGGPWTYGAMASSTRCISSMSMAPDR